MEMINNLPDPTNFRKDEIITMLLKEEYGFLPARPYSVTATVEQEDGGFAAGKATLKKISLYCKGEWGEFIFPVYYAAPKLGTSIPCFIHLNFRDLIPDKYQPTEEIIDNGFAVFTIYYQDITADNDDFTDKFAGVIYPEGVRESDDCGKIGLWAWSAMAVMDYALTLPELDHKKISVVGHSRLGKTALLAGALDKRFYCAFSNDSGCSGASLARETTGETIKNICTTFSYWFCENYKKYEEKVESLPFDQHWLIAANVPHKVYVASAAEDGWACPKNEYLACVAADGYYRKFGKEGFVHPDRLPTVGDRFHEGNIAYHLRGGTHFLGREDWHNYISYINQDD